jgi:hypothetical protein
MKTPSKTKVHDKPIRLGVFTSMPAADQAVHGLLKAGFSKEQISVLCSDKAIEHYFHQFEHQDPAGEHETHNVVTGGAIGMVLGGFGAAAVTVATGGVAVFITAALGALSGIVVGGLTGAMVTRGVESELADYYDQSLQHGKILVAAEAHGDREEESLAKAAHVFEQAGAEPVALDES